MDEQLISTCRRCGVGIELDIGIGPGWPAWITTGALAGTYLCGDATWDDWFDGKAQAHEPIDDTEAAAA